MPLRAGGCARTVRTAWHHARRRWPRRNSSRTSGPGQRGRRARRPRSSAAATRVELAREFGTPAYVVAEDDLRARARAFRAAYAARTTTSRSTSPPRRSRAPRCCGSSREEGLACDVASGGELALALNAGFDPATDHLHGNAKSGPSCARRSTPASAHDRRRQLRRHRAARAARARGARAARADARHAGRRADTHAAISTGGAELEVRLQPRSTRPRRSSALRAVRRAGPRGPAHPHRLADLRPRAVPRRRWRRSPSSATSAPYNLGGGLGVAYTDRATRRRRSRSTSPQGRRGRASSLGARQARCSIEPGRALVANAAVTLYTVESVKRNVDDLRRGRRRHVRQPAADALRRALRGRGRGPRRRGGHDRATSSGKHCESGDVIVRDVDARRPAARRRVVTPVDRRLRLRDGQQLQRRAAAAGGLLLGRRRPRWSCGARPTRTCYARDASVLSRSGRPARPRHGRRARSPTLLAERADDDRARHRPAARDQRRAHAHARRLRRDPRRQRPDRRADGRHRARARLRAARRWPPASTSSPPTSSCSPSTARSCGRPRASTASSCASRPPSRGVVPVIRVLQESLAGAHVERMHGIVNGTTNFILSRDGRDRRGLRRGARPRRSELGYAEADPTDDVSGSDAAAKMAILARLAFDTPVQLDEVPYEGIEHLTADDMDVRPRARPRPQADRHGRARRRRPQRARAPGLPLRAATRSRRSTARSTR